ncbi:MAG: alpha/beta fold hydrolase [Bacteroidales bacterium]|nr:alpha/beta fold hydrolase [Bacteroidales bacterium]
MRSKILIYLPFLLILVNYETIAQVQGKWEGEISILTKKIEMEFDFDKKDNGIMNVPVQGAYNLSVDSINSVDDSVSFYVDSSLSNMRFQGKKITADSISGTFLQSGFEGTFFLTKINREEPDHPWIDKEVRFNNDTVEFAGTLSLPDTTSKHPAIIFISGSGQQTRDENIFGFKIFKEMAPAFIQKGFAVLRYDDRGTGESDHGNPNKCTTKDFADDAIAAFDFLADHSNINNHKIGILGHSEGALIAFMIAQDKNPGFIIMMGGTTVQGDKVLMAQTRAVLESMSIDEDMIRKRLNSNRKLYDEIMKPNTDPTKIKKIFSDLADESGQTQDSVLLNKAIEAQMSAIMQPWFEFFLTYDPSPAIKKLETPVLAMFGGKDIQVTAKQNKPLIDTLINEGRDNFTVKVFPDANHLFQEAETGSVREYSKLSPEFIDGFLDYISNWAHKTVKP